MDMLGYLLIGGIALAFGAQWLLVRKARQAEGQSLPDLDEPLASMLQTNEKSLLYFYSPHCGSCRTMTPIIERLAQERSNVFKFDVSKAARVAHQFQIRGTPTVLVVSPRGIDRVLLGPMTDAALAKLLS